MDDRLLVRRVLPDGRSSVVMMYHISLEGLESSMICRDEEDYDIMVKNIAIQARRCNVIVVIYGVMSNHAHVSVLAESFEHAKKYADAVKKVQSMWLRRKYDEINLLLGREADIRLVSTVAHARNTLAYIPKNAFDSGVRSLQSYKWTGYRGMFCNGKPLCKTIRVLDLTTREIERIMHTGADLSNVSWLLNEDHELEPASFCDWNYLESIFNHDQAFYLRKIGNVNSVEIFRCICRKASQVV